MVVKLNKHKERCLFPDFVYLFNSDQQTFLNANEWDTGMRTFLLFHKLIESVFCRDQSEIECFDSDQQLLLFNIKNDCLFKFLAFIS